MSPYQEALHWIEKHPGTGGATSLAKLVLSLWNEDCAFSFRECVGNLDSERTLLAVRLAQHFARYGEDRDLVEIGHQICDLYPRIWEIGVAATNAKDELRQRWREEEGRERRGE